MSHVLFANPSIARLPLLAAVQRGLLREGDRVTLLSHDPTTHRCLLSQGLQPLRAAPAPVSSQWRLPIRDLAWRDLRLRGVLRPSPGELDRAERNLRHTAGALVRLLETALPDAILCYGARTGRDRLIDLLAREYGCAVLHLGDGLIPGTLQCDPHGVDGDASSADRAALDYRGMRADPTFVEAVLAATISDFRPKPARGLGLFAPDPVDRASTLLDAIRSRAPRRVFRALRDWRLAAEPAGSTERFHPAALAPLAKGPFVAALLQSPDEARMRLDAGEDPPTAEDVIRVARRAAQRIDPALPVIAVLPDEPLPRSARPTPGPGLEILQGNTHLRVSCAAAAAAVATVNHPIGAVSTLAGVPVLHLGKTPWGVPGVATKVDRYPEADAIDAALERPRPALRNRFAVKLLRDEHLWCDPVAPDPNGLRGAVQAVRRCSGAGADRDPQYVPGPAVVSLTDSLDDVIAEE